MPNKETNNRYEITTKDLPIQCPMDNMTHWNSHLVSLLVLPLINPESVLIAVTSMCLLKKRQQTSKKIASVLPPTLHRADRWQL